MFDAQKLARSCILERKEYIPGKPIEEVEREYGISDITKLASNENPLGTSPLAIEAMVTEIRKNSNLYPESLCPDLRMKLSEKLDVGPESFFIDNGADGVITMIGLTFLNPGDEVIFSDVSFPAYDNISTKMGAKSIKIPLRDDYRIDTDGFIKAITPKTKLIFLCNPNNPTGTISDKNEFKTLLESTPEDVLVVSDEAYFEFVTDPDFPGSVDYLDQYQNLIILRTFSKIAGLAGARVGYAMSHKDIVTIMLKAREPFPVNRMAQVGAAAALDDTAFMDKTRELTREGLQFFYESFDEMGLPYWRSNTNFIMVDTGIHANIVFENLLRKGMIVRPLIPQGLDTFLRITIGLMEQNRKCVTVMKEILNVKKEN